MWPVLHRYDDKEKKIQFSEWTDEFAVYYVRAIIMLLHFAWKAHTREILCIVVGLHPFTKIPNWDHKTKIRVFVFVPSFACLFCFFFFLSQLVCSLIDIGMNKQHKKKKRKKKQQMWWSETNTTTSTEIDTFHDRNTQTPMNELYVTWIMTLIKSQSVFFFFYLLSVSLRVWRRGNDQFSMSWSSPKKNNLKTKQVCCQSSKLK